jgi:hypothetical protein
MECHDIRGLLYEAAYRTFNGYTIHKYLYFCVRAILWLLASLGSIGTKLHSSETEQFTPARSSHVRRSRTHQIEKTTTLKTDSAISIANRDGIKVATRFQKLLVAFENSPRFRLSIFLERRYLSYYHYHSRLYRLSASRETQLYFVILVDSQSLSSLLISRYANSWLSRLRAMEYSCY